jgi:hypothetical protein
MPKIARKLSTQSPNKNKNHKKRSSLKSLDEKWNIDGIKESDEVDGIVEEAEEHSIILQQGDDQYMYTKISARQRIKFWCFLQNHASESNTDNQNLLKLDVPVKQKTKEKLLNLSTIRLINCIRPFSYLLILFNFRAVPFLQIFLLVIFEWIFLLLICAYQGKDRLFDGMGHFLRMKLFSITLIFFLCNSFIYSQKIENIDETTGLRISVPKFQEIISPESEPFLQATLIILMSICLSVELGYLGWVLFEVLRGYWREFRG